MKRLPAVLVIVTLLACTTVFAQEQADLERTAADEQLQEKVQRYIDMGMDRQGATLLTVLSETGMSPAEILMMMVMTQQGGGGGNGDGGGGDDGGAGLLLFMNAMKNAGAGQPVVIDRGEQLLVLDGGVLYVMDLQTMAVTGTIDYAAATQPDTDAIWRLVVPMMNEDAAQRAGSCDQRLRVLHSAFVSYMGAHEGALPGQEWVGAIAPYLPTPDALRCPARPQLAVAYAMNGKLTGALQGEIPQPGETVLLFETSLNERSPVGGSQAVPAEGVHDGGVNVLFVDGHVARLTVAEAQNLLDQPIGQ